jgi:hypothetical protein
MYFWRTGGNLDGGAGRIRLGSFTPIVLKGFAVEILSKAKEVLGRVKQKESIVQVILMNQVHIWEIIHAV